MSQPLTEFFKKNIEKNKVSSQWETGVGLSENGQK